MKIRTDFVTNSSSSSFTCVAMYSEDLYNYLQKLIEEKKYRKQPGWNSRPKDELHIDCAWEELKFDNRWFKVQTTEEYGKTDKQSVYDYICWFFDGLTDEEKDTIWKLISEVYKKKDYQTKKYKDATDGFVGFNFDGPAVNKKAAAYDKEKEKKTSNEYADAVIDELPYQTPLYPFYKQRAIDINEIDLDGKMIDIYALDHCKNRDDEKNLYYGDYGTAIDIAEAVIANYGGRCGHQSSPDINYLVVSRQMHIPKEYENTKSLLRDMYKRYCSSEKSKEKVFLKMEEKRRKDNLPEIKIIFEDDFHKWLEKQFDIFKGEGLFQSYGIITTTVSTEDSMGVGASFKSEAFSKISQKEMEDALYKSNSLSDFYSSVEAFTKEGAFWETNKGRMLDYEKENIQRYTNIKVSYESSDGTMYSISKEM